MTLWACLLTNWPKYSRTCAVSVQIRLEGLDWIQGVSVLACCFSRCGAAKHLLPAAGKKQQRDMQRQAKWKQTARVRVRRIHGGVTHIVTVFSARVVLLEWPARQNAGAWQGGRREI